MNTDDEASQPNEAFEPIRQRVNIEVGALVQQANTVYRITQVLDFETAIGVEVESGRSAPLRIMDLRVVSNEQDADRPDARDISEIADDDWRVAEQRFAAIKPLTNRGCIGRNNVDARALEVGVDTTTLYRWLRRYNTYGEITALIPRKPGWKDGKSRIPVHADEVITQVINQFYLTPQRPTVQKAIIEVQRVCLARGIEPPGVSTVRNRIAKLTEKETLRGRGHKEKAKNKFLPAAGSFPNADFPLSVVQIDHTPADIILVDDVYRKPIGRPWITLAIDVYSRMIVGYYLSFDAPSETSVALCVAHACIPKESWLLLHDVDAKWPVWGIPRTIHVDNGTDFRSNSFRKSCLMHGINLEFRPVKQPRYGGHIERLIGTIVKEIHDLPGTTFSSIKERDSYDAEKNAVMSKSEFETWLVSFICKVYHQRKHSSIGMSPSRQWEIGIFGNTSTQGVGVPPRPSDPMTLLLDFLPSFQRTVQTFGVSIDNRTYYAEALRPWINATDPETGKKQQCTFRRDPRDISVIWFFDPLLKQYFKVPFANQALPAMSAWEHQQARELLKKEGGNRSDDNNILRSITQLRDQVDAAKGRTKTARRQAQRQKEHARKVSPAAPLPAQPTRPVKVLTAPETGLLDGDIDTFGDIS